MRSVVPFVHCKDCQHRGISYECPMCFDETYDDDGYTEWYTIDNTTDDGYCNNGEDDNGIKNHIPTNIALSDLSYPEQVAYHKGAFAALLALKNVIELTQKKSKSERLFSKKASNIMLSYINEAISNIDEFLAYQGIPYGIIDKEGNYKRIDEANAMTFMQHNIEKYNKEHGPS